MNFVEGSMEILTFKAVESEILRWFLTPPKKAWLRNSKSVLFG